MIGQLLESLDYSCLYILKQKSVRKPHMHLWVLHIISISSDEIGELLHIVGIEASKDELDAMIKHIDVDNSGEIDFEGKIFSTFFSGLDLQDTCYCYVHNFLYTYFSSLLSSILSFAKLCSLRICFSHDQESETQRFQ